MSQTHNKHARVRTIMGIALLALTALLFTACGSTKPMSKGEYTSTVRAVGEQTSQALSDVFATGTKAPSASALRAASKHLHTSVTTLQSLTPPTEVKDANADLVAGLRQLASALNGIADKVAAAKTDAQRLEAFSSGSDADKAHDALATLEQAQKEYLSKGYSVLGKPAPASPPTQPPPTATGTPPSPSSKPPTSAAKRSIAPAAAHTAGAAAHTAGAAAAPSSGSTSSSQTNATIPTSVGAPGAEQDAQSSVLPAG